MRPATILIIEDNPSFQNTMQTVVQKLGHIAVLKEDPVEAVHWARKERFHCAVVDRKLKGDSDHGPYSGDVVVEKLTKSPFSCYTPPIIIVTHFPDLAAQRLFFRDYKVVDFVDRTKPEWQGVLEQAVKDAILRTGIDFTQDVELDGGLVWGDITGALITRSS